MLPGQAGPLNTSATRSPAALVGVTMMWCWVRVGTKVYHTSSSAVPVWAGMPESVALNTVPLVPPQVVVGVRAWALAHRSLAGGVWAAADRGSSPASSSRASSTSRQAGCRQGLPASEGVRERNIKMNKKGLEMCPAPLPSSPGRAGSGANAPQVVPLAPRLPNTLVTNADTHVT